MHRWGRKQRSWQALQSPIQEAVARYLGCASRLMLQLLIIVHLSGCNSHPDRSRIGSIEIVATGDAYNWYFTYPGVDGVLGTDDDQYSTRNLFLPDYASVTLKLRSKDYIYSFALPELDQKQIAVPDLDFELQFKTGAAQKLQLLGDQFCGYAHKTLIGEVLILNQEDGFYGWAT